MKVLTFSSFSILVLFTALFIIAVMYAVDIEVARADYNEAQTTRIEKVENCIFQSICDRYTKLLQERLGR